jgi:dUTP pyrophosphatase
MILDIKIVNQSKNELPTYAYEGSAGMDIKANESVLIMPGETQMIGTGLFMQLPRGYELQIRSRSGLGSKGIVVAQGVGTIDCGYTGEIKVLLRNQNRGGLENAFKVEVGDRICQAILAEIFIAKFEVVTSLDSSERGTGGFGSSGVK